MDACHTRCGSRDELLAALRINRPFVRSHAGIGITFMRQRKDRHEQARMLFIIEQHCPSISAKLHPARKALCPVVRVRDPVIAFQQKRQEGLAAVEAPYDSIPVTHEKLEELLHLGFVAKPFRAADVVTAPNHPQVLAWGNSIRATDERGEETVKRLQVYRAIAAREHGGDAVVLGIAQRLLQRFQLRLPHNSPPGARKSFPRLRRIRRIEQVQELRAHLRQSINHGLRPFEVLHPPLEAPACRRVRRNVPQIADLIGKLY